MKVNKQMKGDTEQDSSPGVGRDDVLKRSGQLSPLQKQFGQLFLGEQKHCWNIVLITDQDKLKRTWKHNPMI